MSKKIVSLLLGVSVMAALLGGCGGKESGGESSRAEQASGDETKTGGEEASGGEVKTLEFMWFADGNETAAMRKVLDKYEELHPDIKVELVEVPYADLNEKLMMAITGGEAPALSRVTGSPLFFDAALDLTDALGGADTFFADYPESMRSNTAIIQDGKIYAIPGEASITGMVYNKTAFEQAGVKVPASSNECWTWEEFNQAVEKVVENSDVRYGLVLDGTSQRWSNVLYEFGGRFLTEDGQAAAHIGGSWLIASYSDSITDFEWSVTYLPYSKVRGNCTGYKQFMGFEGSGYEEEAKELLAYLASAESASYYSESLYISPRLDGAQLEYTAGSEQFAILNEDAAAATSASTIDWGYPNFSTAYNTVIINTVKEYIAGNITVEECMAEMDAAADNLSQ